MSFPRGIRYLIIPYSELTNEMINRSTSQGWASLRENWNRSVFQYRKVVIKSQEPIHDILMPYRHYTLSEIKTILTASEWL